MIGQLSVTLKIKKQRGVFKMKTQMKSEIDIQDSGDTDRLGDLPDHILVHIIEFMDIKQSVQTCVLSKRWEGLWRKLTNLKFNHSGDRIDIFSKFVSQILSGRDDSLPLHSLEYVHKLQYQDFPKTTLLEVVKYAASHNVQQLTVHVYLWLIKDLELPPSIFHCQSLTSLKLDFFCPSAHASARKMFPKSLNLSALKTLHLSFLTFTTSDNGYAEPFSTCNMLSTLVIIGCYLQDDTQALCISNSNVSSLTVDNCTYEKAHRYKVVFCTPKLTSLTIIGRPTFLAPSECNLPFLEEGNIDFDFLKRPYEGLLVINCLQLLANVKIMTLSFNTLSKLHKVSYFSIF
jgi:hypothetical protein